MGNKIGAFAPQVLRQRSPASARVPDDLGAGLVEAGDVLAHEVEDVGSVAAFRSRTFDVRLPSKSIAQRPAQATLDKSALDAKDQVAEERRAAARPYVTAEPNRGRGVRLEKPRESGATLPRMEVVRPTRRVADQDFGRKPIGLLVHRLDQLPRQQRDEGAQQFARTAIAQARGLDEAVGPSCFVQLIEDQLRLASGTRVAERARAAAESPPEGERPFMKRTRSTSDLGQLTGWHALQLAPPHRVGRMQFAHHQEIVGGAAFWRARQLGDDAACDLPLAPQLGAQALARERGRGKPYGFQVAQTDVLRGNAAQATARGARERR